MTKERRIAIDMWKYIRDQYPGKVQSTEDYVIHLKDQYLKEHGNPGWAFNCWFCHYIAKRNRPEHYYNPKGCKKCPLQTCGIGPYHLLCNARTKGVWVMACNKIIRALGGKA